MAQVVVSAKAAIRIAEIREFYDEKDPEVAARAMTAILTAFRPLEKFGAMGRPAIENPQLRELVIPFGNTGFMALYRLDRERDRVVILAIRHQREAGYE
jgi:plasmid stabilization system protein ParE